MSNSPGEQTPVLSVLSGGFLSTIQDRGRFGFAHLGISQAGAADEVSLRLGNLLVGNHPGAAAVEMTLVGGSFRVESRCMLAVTGSDFSPTLDGLRLPLWRSFDAFPGQMIALQATRGGARCYLSVRGGFNIPQMLNSASTHVLTHLGGVEGRNLGGGDVLFANPISPVLSQQHRSVRHDVLDYLFTPRPIRVTDGPQVNDFGQRERSIFFSREFLVTENSNRMGLRLSGPSIMSNRQTELVTEGVQAGAIQIPPDGQPIILFVEHPTTGGYPKIASVISADFHRVGQLRPRDLLRFEHVTHEAALELLSERESLLQLNRSLESVGGPL